MRLAFAIGVTRRQMRALEDLVTRLARAQPTDGSLAVLQRLLATLGQRRRPHLRSLSERADELLALLRWIYR